jgi:hypothetical protein
MSSKNKQIRVRTDLKAGNSLDKCNADVQALKKELNRLKKIYG